MSLCFKEKRLFKIKRLGAALLTSWLLASFMSPVVADLPSQVLFLVENKRLEASICPDSMNRIAVANDRIVQFFGDEGAYESQVEENTGQIFIKPTAENSTKPLSLTLITEQGKTQDLSLKPLAKIPTTLILKSSDKAHKSSHEGKIHGGHHDGPGAPEAYSRTPSLEKSASIQEQLLATLKSAVGGQLPLKDSTPPLRPSPEGYKLTPHQSYQAGGFVVNTFHLENITSTPISADEKTFYQPGDLALSLQNRVIPSHEKTLLYTVRLEAE